MSRIGKKPIQVPDNVKVAVNGNTVDVEGPLGKLQQTFRREVEVSHDADTKQLVVTRKNDEPESRAFHGLTRALLQNMIEGVTKGYEKRLEIVGVGYLGAVQG